MASNGNQLAAARKKKEDEIRLKRELARKYLEENTCGPVNVKKSVAEKVGLEGTMHIYRREKAKQMMNPKPPTNLPTKPSPRPAIPAPQQVETIPETWEVINSLDSSGAVARAYRHCPTGCLTSQKPKKPVAGINGDNTPLARGWKLLRDPTLSRVFYWQPATGQVSWEVPKPIIYTHTVEEPDDKQVDTKAIISTQQLKAEVTSTDTSPSTEVQHTVQAMLPKAQIYKTKPLRKRMKIVKQ